MIIAGHTADNALVGIGGVDFRVDVGFGFDCLDIGSMDSRINCSWLLQPRVGMPILLLVSTGYIILELELDLKVLLLNLILVNIR